MLRRLVPRRLLHDEEAPLVDHLGELRHRIFVSLFAFVPLSLLKERRWQTATLTTAIDPA